MTRKLTLSVVCAFEIALIPFLAARIAWAEPKSSMTKIFLPLFQYVRYRRY